MDTSRRLLMLVAACALSGACAPAERNEEGEIAVAGALDAFSMQIGDCYDDQTLFSDEVSDVPAIPCAQPHDNEVFALFDLPMSEWPGEDQVFELADEGCYERFAEYVGASYEESILMITTLVPSKDSWRRIKDREVICVAYHMELEKLEGSVRGTGM